MKVERIGNAALWLGDCVEAMRAMEAASVDSIVCDPPYELGFMGKAWDATGIAYSAEMWREALRVLKPGGHLLAFSGSRTYHRMACAIEDAGFEIRDQIMWVYGSGFPKSLDVSKAIDKAAGAEREILGEQPDRWTGKGSVLNFSTDRAQASVPVTGGPATDASRQWQGWGTALKPAHEPIVMARKPLAGTVAANVLTHGTGGLNIDGCRIDGAKTAAPVGQFGGSTIGPSGHAGARDGSSDHLGRWPANFIHDGSRDVLAGFPESTSGAMKAGTRRAAQDGPGSVCYGTFGGNATSAEIEASAGSAARFFYCAKASREDRNEGLPSSAAPAVSAGATMGDRETADWPARNGNFHPTVKPTDLMRWLVRLVTPAGGTVLDPFMGSGSTGKAARLEAMKFIGVEMQPEYFAIARRRIEQASRQGHLFEAVEPEQAQMGLEAA
jgi:DNA modification methylase